MLQQGIIRFIIRFCLGRSPMRGTVSPISVKPVFSVLSQSHQSIQLLLLIGAELSAGDKI